VTEVVLEEYVAWLSTTFAPTTAHRETAHVKAAYRYAVPLGTIEKSPAEYIEAPKVLEELDADAILHQRPQSQGGLEGREAPPAITTRVATPTVSSKQLRRR